MIKPYICNKIIIIIIIIININIIIIIIIIKMMLIIKTKLKKIGFPNFLIFQFLNFSNFFKHLESKHDVKKYIADKNNKIGEHRKRSGYVYNIFTQSKLQLSLAHKYKLCCNISFFIDKKGL